MIGVHGALREPPVSATKKFIDARDCLLRGRENLLGAQREFSWPKLDEFNWGRDHFDVIASGNDLPALRVVDDTGADESVSFAQLARRSCQLANFLAALGVGHGDRILVMLGNATPLWETILAAIKVGAVIIPAPTLLEHGDLADRIVRGRVKAVVTHSHLAGRLDEAGRVELKVAVGPEVPDWIDYAGSRAADDQFATRVPTRSPRVSSSARSTPH